MSGTGKQAVIDRLREYERGITEIIDLIGESEQVKGKEKSRVQNRLENLKADLQADLKKLHRRRDEMSRHEQNYLAPALQDARADLTIRADSTPGQDWVANLSEVRTDITYLLDQLERSE